MVNPIDAQEELVGSASGFLFRTEDTGANWFMIANPGVLDGSQLTNMAFGAPDPAIQNNGSLDDFIYAGTRAGNVFVTQTGGNAWTNISFGLDGSNIRQIITDPNRGSHDAYALTSEGVYYLPDSQVLLNDIAKALANPLNPADKVPLIDGWQRIDGAFTPKVATGGSASVPNAGMNKSTLSFPVDNNTFPIGHLSVTVNISATSDADLTGVLIAPNGQQITLFQGATTSIPEPGISIGLTNTTFDDDAAANALRRRRRRARRTT